jgi:5-methylcytosine-specific restriction endonuclease McrA
MKKKPKLIVELIPKTCQYSNVRTTLKSKDWDKIRFIVYEKAEHKCEICKQTGLEQGYKHRVECHEIWEYNDNKKIQKLIGLIALCPLCHQVKHIGRSTYMGKKEVMFEHLSKINNWNLNETTQHVDEAYEINKMRSEHKWELDLTLITKSPYNIKIANKKRKFKIKYKKRKKQIKKHLKKN